MPDVYGPFTGQTWTQAQWFRDAYARSISGVYGNAAAATTAGDLPLTVAGLVVSVGLGRAHVRGAGYERTGTAWSATLATNTNANPRIDRIVLRRDLTAGTITPTVLQGTPAATPTAPAITQAEDTQWDLPLFSMTVPGGSGTTLTGITDERTWVGTGEVGRDPARATGTIATAAANWTVDAANTWGRRLGLGWVIVNVRVAYASATAITVPANGDVGNVQVATLAAGWIPLDQMPLINGQTGPVSSGYANNGGAVALTAVAPGTVISNAAPFTVDLTGVLFTG